MCEREVKQLSQVEEESEIQLESLKELLTFLRESSGPELIDVRRRLREELRGLIDRIEVFPIGRTIWTEFKVQQALTAIKSYTKTKDFGKIEADLLNRIENKEFRTYEIHFKGGSFRILRPGTPQKLSLDWNKEEDIMMNYVEGVDGKIVVN